MSGCLGGGNSVPRGGEIKMRLFSYTSFLCFRDKLSMGDCISRKDKIVLVMSGS